MDAEALTWLQTLHERFYEHSGAMNATQLSDRDYGRKVIAAALAERLATAEATTNEWRSFAAADATGHLMRCAKVNGEWMCVMGCPAARLRSLEGALADVKAKLEAASEERYQVLTEWEREAQKWKREGDMYGWNFHMGMAAGANWCDIFYRRIGRSLEAFRAALTSAPPPGPQSQ